jgi:hypothetical protein
MKRRDLERHLRAHGCRQIDEGGNHSRWAGPEGARGRPFRVIARSTTAWRGRSVGSYPSGMEADLLFRADRTCCVCRAARAAQLHHIDGDRSNTVIENLAPVCTNCHGEIGTPTPFPQGFTAELAVRYRDEWYAIVAARRERMLSVREPTYFGPPSTPQSVGFRLSGENVILRGNRSIGAALGFDAEARNVDARRNQAE